MWRTHKEDRLSQPLSMRWGNLRTRKGKDIYQMQKERMECLSFFRQKPHGFLYHTPKLSFLFRVDNPYLNIDKLRGIRNRVAHDYESVIIDILLDAIEKDLPELKSKLLSALDSNNK